MEHRLLGCTGVSVSKLCLGAMMFGSWGNPDHDDSIRIIHAALEAGINFIDTADVYGAGESEEIVGKALKQQFEGQVAAADVVLDEAVLDRIDEVVPPGVTVNPVDNSFDNPALQPAARRR